MNLYDERIWLKFTQYRKEEVDAFFFKHYGYTGTGRKKIPKKETIYFSNRLLIHRVEIFGIEYFFSYRYENCYLPILVGIVSSHVSITELPGGIIRVQKRHELLSDSDVDLHVTMLVMGVE
jgi:hypothetical protein